MHSLSRFGSVLRQVDVKPAIRKSARNISRCCHVSGKPTNEMVRRLIHLPGQVDRGGSF
jgi:hypothetical protein